MSASSNLTLSLRLRANADGSLSVIPQTTHNINQMSAATDRSGRVAANSAQSFGRLASSALDINGAARAAAAGLSTLALFETARRVINIADNMKLLDGRIRLATGTTNDYSIANAELLDLSMRTGSSFESNATLFSRINSSLQVMGGNTRTTLQFTELLAKSLRLSNAGQAESASIIRQLSQAMASGVLRGDEFNSIMENSERSARALADGLSVDIGVLRAMAEAGELSSSKVAKAILSQAAIIDAEYSRMPLTVGMALENVNTQFGQYIKNADDGAGATAGLSSTINTLANNITPILNTVVTLGKIGIGYAVASLASGVASYGQSVIITRTHTQALAIEAARTAAARVADAEATAAHTAAVAIHTQTSLADVAATQSVIAVSRAESIAQLATTNQCIASARATIAATNATIQNTSVRWLNTQAVNELAIAEARRATIVTELAVLGRQQAAITAELTAAQVVQTAAQNAANIAAARLNALTREAAAGASILSRAVGFLGGPVGVITTLLGFGVTAWMLWGSTAKKELSETEQKAQSAANAMEARQVSFADKMQGTWSLIGKSAQQSSSLTQTEWDAVWRQEQQMVDKFSEHMGYTIGFAWENIQASAAINANYLTGTFIGIAAVIEEVFNTIYTNISNSLDNVVVGAAAAGKDIKAAMHFDFSASNTQSVVFKPIKKGDINTLSHLFDEKFNADYIGNVTSAINTEAEAVNGLRNNLDKAAESAAKLDTSNKDYHSRIRDASTEVEKLKTIEAMTRQHNERLKKLNEDLVQSEKDAAAEIGKANNDLAIAQASHSQAKINSTNEALRLSKKQYEQHKNNIAQLVSAENSEFSKSIGAAKKESQQGALDSIKKQEEARKAAYDSQIKDIERVAQAKQDLNTQAVKQVDFDYQQNNIGLQKYLLEREHLIRESTANQVAGYEQQKQAAIASAESIAAMSIKLDSPENEAYFDSLLEKFHGDLQKTTDAYVKVKGDLSILPTEQISASQEIIDLNEKISQAYQKQAADLKDLGRTAITENQANLQSLDNLLLKYTELNGTARQYFTLKQSMESREGLKKATANNDTATVHLIENNNKVELAKFDQNAASAYQEKLLEINKSTREIGVTSTEAFDLVNKGIGGIATAFNTALASQASVNDAIAKNSKDMGDLAKNTQIGEAERAGFAAAYAKKSIKLEQEKTAASLTGVRQTTGAFANMFAENTKGRKAFHNVEMVLGGIELAYNLANNAQEIAANGVKMVSNVASAATKIWSQMGIFAPIGLAVMAGSLAAWGAGAFSGGSVAQAPKASADTGTVLGDNTAQSQSVDNIISTLKDIHASEYPELAGINTNMSRLSASLSATITTLFQAGGLDLSNKGINLSYGLGDSLTRSFTTGAGIASSILSTGISTAISLGTTAAITSLSGAAVTGLTTAAAGPLAGLGIGSLAGPIGIAAGLLFSGINALFTGGYRSVVERGIQTPSQSISNVMSSGFDVAQYNVVKTRSWDLFSDSTRYDTVLTKLNNKVEAALENVFSSAGKVSLGLAEQLGGDLSDRVKNYVIPSLKIDLTKLNAEDASKKLNAVISTTLDTMSNEIFGATVGQYQKLGEGMLETATRIVAEVAVVREALSQSSMSMPQDAIAVADALAQAAGGLKEFQNQFSDYYESFYSDAEKSARLQTNLTNQLQAVYLGLPATRDGYRALVDALDLNNTKDRERYSLLIKLAGAADSYYNALDNGLKTYKDKASSAYDTAAKLLQDQVSTYGNFVSQLKQFSDSLVTGSLSNANPRDKYQAARTAFFDLKNTLDTGTEAQKQSALEKLQAVTQAYIESSRAYNASGLGYVRDSAEAQALLAKSIAYSTDKKDVAQTQLDRLTEQVSALGLINTSVLSVKDAVDALNLAMAGYKNAQEAQAKIAADNANKAKFLEQQAASKNQYQASINQQAAAYGANNGKFETQLGWDAGASSRPFYAAGSFDTQTASTLGGLQLYSESSRSGGVKDELANTFFPRIRNSLSIVAQRIQNLTGGNLPNVAIKFGDDQRYGPGYFEYAFGSVKKRLATDKLPEIQRAFADDMTDYLAMQLSNPDWQSQVKAVSYPNLTAGFTELYRVMSQLKNPFSAGAYDPNKDYAKIDGSHKSGLDSVPFDGYIAELHQGERVMTAADNKLFTNWFNDSRTLSTTIKQGDNKAVIEQLKLAIEELKKANKTLTDQSKHLAAGVAVDQAGYVKLITKMQLQINELEKGNRSQRIVKVNS